MCNIIMLLFCLIGLSDFDCAKAKARCMLVAKQPTIQSQPIANQPAVKVPTVPNQQVNGPVNGLFQNRGRTMRCVNGRCGYVN